MKYLKENKRRKKNKPLLSVRPMLSTSKYTRSWYEKHWMTDPDLHAGELNDDWFEETVKMIPYRFCEGNKDKAFVDFYVHDKDYIHTWLMRIVQEVAHKSHSMPKLQQIFDQVLNHKGTHGPLEKTNTALTLAAGLNINYMRDGGHYRFVHSQLELLETVFWFSYWHLRRYPYYDGDTAITKQDVGFNRQTHTDNEDLMPILFVKQNKNNVSGRKVDEKTQQSQSILTGKELFDHSV